MKFSCFVFGLPSSCLVFFSFSSRRKRRIGRFLWLKWQWFRVLMSTNLFRIFVNILVINFTDSAINETSWCLVLLKKKYKALQYWQCIRLEFNVSNLKFLRQNIFMYYSVWFFIVSVIISLALHKLIVKLRRLSKAEEAAFCETCSLINDDLLQDCARNHTSMPMKSHLPGKNM